MRKILLVGFMGMALLCAAGPSSAVDKQNGFYNMPAPQGSRLIKFPSDDFKVRIEEPSTPYYFYVNERTGMNISFNFIPADKCKSSEDCRQYFADARESRPYKGTQWNFFQEGDIYVSEYMIETAKGVDIMQRHMNAHYVFDGIWLDVHISKIHYQKSDRKLFMDLIRSVKIEMQKS